MSSFFNKSILQSALKERQLFLFESIDSTNQYLLNQAQALSSGSVCLAEEQTAGRGRRGRVWHSPKAENIYLSQFFEFYDGQSLSGLSIAIGVTIANVLNTYLLNANKTHNIDEIKVKWPNDLYWNDKKLGGILLETVPISANKMGVVVGVGINLLMQKNQNTAYIMQDWVSLAQITSTPLNKTNLVVELIKGIDVTFAQYSEEGLQPFLSSWLEYDAYLNKQVKIITENDNIFGIARGIDMQGALLVEINDELVSFHSGEVSLRKV